MGTIAKGIKPGLRAAVNAKCRECIYDPCQPGTWLAQVRACTSPRCPLYMVRPGVKLAQKQAAVPLSHCEPATRMAEADSPDQEPA